MSACCSYCHSQRQQLAKELSAIPLFRNRHPSAFSGTAEYQKVTVPLVDAYPVFGTAVHTNFLNLLIFNNLQKAEWIAPPALRDVLSLLEYQLDKRSEVSSPDSPFVTAGTLLPHQSGIAFGRKGVMIGFHAVNTTVLFTAGKVYHIKLVELGRAGEHPRKEFFGIEGFSADGGRTDQAGRKDPDVGECVNIGEGDKERLAAPHRKSGDRPSFPVGNHLIILFDERNDVGDQR